MCLFGFQNAIPSGRHTLRCAHHYTGRVLSCGVVSHIIREITVHYHIAGQLCAFQSTRVDTQFPFLRYLKSDILLPLHAPRLSSLPSHLFFCVRHIEKRKEGEGGREVGRDGGREGGREGRRKGERKRGMERHVEGKERESKRSVMHKKREEGMQRTLKGVRVQHLVVCCWVCVCGL